jgi:hypothetical protein
VRFQAISVGIEVPTSYFSGTVHSVFRQACNLSIEPHKLLTLLPSEKGNVPQGIRLNASSQLAFLDLLRVGQPVACRGGILRIDGVLSIDLRNADLWHIDLTALPIDLRRPDHMLSWAAAWFELRASHHTIGLPEIMHAVSFPGEQRGSSVVPSAALEWSTRTIPALLRAIRDLRLDDAMTAIGSVIGRGPGLTPSGDDFLVGYLAGLWCGTESSPPRVRFLTALGSELFQAARRTNDISCAYLRSAAEGHVSEPLATLAQQLYRADNLVLLRTAAQAALHIGHTSGTDGVLGLLLGCLAWQNASALILRDVPFNNLKCRIRTAH